VCVCVVVCVYVSFPSTNCSAPTKAPFSIQGWVCVRVCVSVWLKSHTPTPLSVVAPPPLRVVSIYEGVCVCVCACVCVCVCVLSPSPQFTQALHLLLSSSLLYYAHTDSLHFS
jgi:hypothetical protein